ncbi:MAG: Asp-tRNA(Asn)/Glu-tRNA(Gln) amidotransferase subunit GatC [Microbacteriaceae bacterium]|nr:Asp-tRNA(Asn)/Glu-tRNA(Gln) amidotransferase subunit GatC [Microbacteriaceae bacterium]
MSEITPETISHLANLARIALTEEEKELLATQLDAILDAVAKVGEVTTPDVPRTSHPVPLVNVFRNDEEVHTLDREAALGNAPDSDGTRFRVPAILGEE